MIEDVALVSQAVEALKGNECTEMVLVCDPPASYDVTCIDVKVRGVPMTVVASVYRKARTYDMAEFQSVLTGIGVGGGVALMLAVITLLEKGEAVPVCTFGAPAVGCTMFASVAAKLDHVRFLHRADVVASQGLFFRHPCKATYIGKGSVPCLLRAFSKCMCELGCGVEESIPRSLYIRDAESYIQDMVEYGMV